MERVKKKTMWEKIDVKCDGVSCGLVRIKGCVQKSVQTGLIHAKELSFVLRSKCEMHFCVLFYAYEFFRSK